MSWQGRNAIVVRQWRMLVLLRQRPRTVLELAHALNVCERTIRRDLDALSEVFPVGSRGEQGRGNRAFYQLEAMSEWPAGAIAPVQELRA